MEIVWNEENISAIFTGSFHLFTCEELIQIIWWLDRELVEYSDEIESGVWNYLYELKAIIKDFVIEEISRL